MLSWHYPTHLILLACNAESKREKEVRGQMKEGEESDESNKVVGNINIKENLVTVF